MSWSRLVRWTVAFACSMSALCQLRASEPLRLPVKLTVNGSSTLSSSSSASSLQLYYFSPSGTQIALLADNPEFVVDAAPKDVAIAAIPCPEAGKGGLFSAVVTARGPGPVRVSLSSSSEQAWQSLAPGQSLQLETPCIPGSTLNLATSGTESEGAVFWESLSLQTDAEKIPLLLDRGPSSPHVFPSPELPAARPAIEEALIEWDWRMQDGIGSRLCPATYAEAIEQTFVRGDALLSDLQNANNDTEEFARQWNTRREQWREMIKEGKQPLEESRARLLWRELHLLKRRIVLSNPLVKTGSLVFIKHTNSTFSHQLTEYTGNCARPGGGLFLLEEPGVSMRCRQLASGLPLGSYQFADVSYDGQRVLFSFCAVDMVPPNREVHLDHYFHLYEAALDGSSARQLSSGAFDDFAPRYLPDGKIIFLSTRRGGFHRCGQGPCPVHTLSVCEADGSDPRPISFHETHEWDPCVLNDGRVIYTRWDYVDRHAVHYQQLWTVRPDGTDVRAYYGNHTLNPVGVWEARPIPGSSKIMATAAAHHAMTAGSVILLDVTSGVDDLNPITRLTPDALFPESEAPVARLGPGSWHAPYAVQSAPPTARESGRWPGQCYKSPFPLSEKYFLASYSFDPLIGEPDANPPNMFGIYLVDVYGNKELLYRDLNISSLWAMPIAPRPRPPALPRVAGADTASGTFILQNVYESWPPIPEGSVKSLRVIQVLPKSTWHANQPTLGLPSASPGKQVLGTVPVEADGSAYFQAPAKIPLLFQALDENGQAIQTMRSLTYLQPGETSSCVGCHESRSSAPSIAAAPLALDHPPASIRPGPDGSKPLSYPILVQPVLDKHCVSCHSREKPEGNIVLTGEAEGRYSASYNALAPRVSFSEWGGRPGDFRVVNSEPLTRPDFFGARASGLMTLLRQGHHEVRFAAEDFERLATWMDANALFYGTFDPEDQSRQQRGERIAGPKVE